VRLPRENVRGKRVASSRTTALHPEADFATVRRKQGPIARGELDILGVSGAKPHAPERRHSGVFLATRARPVR